MRLRKARRTYGTQVSIAPLIDVVFLLIIFFMTVSQFARVEVEAVTLPEARKGRKPKELRTSRLIVNLLSDGRIVTAGETHTPASLQRRLAQHLDGRPGGELAVLLRGDRDAPWKQAAAVLRACAANGIDRVRVAVIDPAAHGAP